MVLNKLIKECVITYLGSQDFEVGHKVVRRVGRKKVVHRVAGRAAGRAARMMLVA
jgi:hypothetical protein